MTAGLLPRPDGMPISYPVAGLLQGALTTALTTHLFRRLDLSIIRLRSRPSLCRPIYTFHILLYAVLVVAATSKKQKCSLNRLKPDGKSLESTYWRHRGHILRFKWQKYNTLHHTRFHR
jgi:hypothetical protein